MHIGKQAEEEAGSTTVPPPEPQTSTRGVLSAELTSS